LPVSGSKIGSKNRLSGLFHSLENKEVEELYQFVEKGTEVEFIP
jgi:hypothetical protein